MKKTIKGVIITSALLAGLFVGAAHGQEVSAKSFGKAVTKIAGDGNYAIYHNVSKGGPGGKFTSTKYFKHGQIQSKEYVSTKKGDFWNIIVDGRKVGWVSEKFFARNQIFLGGSVSVVKNSDYSFPTRDAINYATDSQGTAVNPSKVNVSKAYVCLLYTSDAADDSGTV